MDSFEWNKIAGAILATALFVMVLRVGVETLYHEEPLTANAYPIAVPEGEETTTVADTGPSFAELLADATAAQGEIVFAKCTLCHTIEEGGRALTGPNLYNIVGRDIAAGDFPYSKALAEIDDVWDYENLDAFLAKPSGYARGTKMAFVGLAKPEDRARVIQYLRVNSENPPPLPLVEIAAEETAAEETMPEETTEETPAEAPTEAPAGEAEASPTPIQETR